MRRGQSRVAPHPLREGRSVWQLAAEGALSEHDVDERGVLLPHARARHNLCRARNLEALHRSARTGLRRFRAVIDVPVCSVRLASSTDLARDMCVVCWNEQRTHAMVPCFHFCVCAGCGARLGHCPICRRDKLDVQRIYVA